MSTPSRHDRKRARKALKLANKLIFSYLFLWLLRRLIGSRRYEKRLLSLHQKNSKRVKRGILDLQGLFIKVGQLISALSHILPEAYMETLESLQDNAPATDFNDSRRQIESSLEESIDALFTNFNETPIASASIGQVYKARLRSGEQVAVKVQHTNIRELAKEDLKIVQRLIRRVAFFFKIQGLDHIYSQVKQMIEDELDYRKEANSMQIIGKNLSRTAGIIVPKVYTEYSSDKVLVSSFEEGVKITNTQQLKEWGIDPKVISERLILTYCKMVLEDGFYHADPHPGNILVNENGDIILLDFGATAHMDDNMRRELPILIQAIIRKDHGQILRSLQKIGFIGDTEGSEKVANKLIETMSNFLQNEVKIDNMNLKDLSFNDIKGSSLDRLRKEISMKELTSTVQVPKDWVLLDRTLALVIGISTTIAPELNPMEVIKPYMKRLILRDGGLKNMIIDTIKQQVTGLLGLPTEMSRFLKKANNGELKLGANGNQNKLYFLGQQLILALFIIASIGFHLYSHKVIFLYSAIISGVFLLRSVWKHRKL